MPLEPEAVDLEAELPDFPLLLFAASVAAFAPELIAPAIAPLTAPLAASFNISVITSAAWLTMPCELLPEDFFLAEDLAGEDFLPADDLLVDFEADLAEDDVDLAAGLAADVDLAAGLAAADFAVFGADLAAGLVAVLAFVAAVPEAVLADSPADADFDVVAESAFFPAADLAAAGFLLAAAFAVSFFDFVVAITFSLKVVLNRTYERIFTQKIIKCQGIFCFI